MYFRPSNLVWHEWDVGIRLRYIYIPMFFGWLIKRASFRTWHTDPSGRTAVSQEVNHIWTVSAMTAARSFLHFLASLKGLMMFNVTQKESSRNVSDYCSLPLLLQNLSSEHECVTASARHFFAKRWKKVSVNWHLSALYSVIKLYLAFINTSLRFYDLFIAHI